MIRFLCLLSLLMFGLMSPAILHAQSEASPPGPKREEPKASLVGKWRWIENQVVTVKPDLTFKAAKGRKGTWKWKEGTERTYILSWDDGLYVDEVILSQDGKSLSGRNNDKKKIKAERIE